MNRLHFLAAYCAVLTNVATTIAGGAASAGDTIKMVSTTSGGSPGDADSGLADERTVSVSADGRRIVFISDASDLDTSVDYEYHLYGDSRNAFVTYINLNGTQTTACLTVDSADRALGLAHYVEISDDGRWAAVGVDFYPGTSPAIGEYGEFESDYNTKNIIVYDLNSIADRACATCDIGDVSGGACIEPTLSSDGTVIAFTLFHNASPPSLDRVVYREVDVSHSPPTFGDYCNIKNDSDEIYYGSHHPKISGDGAHIAFTSIFSPDESCYPAEQVLRYSIGESWCDGSLALVSTYDEDPADANSGIIWLSRTGLGVNDEDLDISNDGSMIAFGSAATNLGAGSVGRQIYRRNMDTDEVLVISKTSAGVVANATAFGCSISGNGACTAFLTSASNFPNSNGKVHGYLKYNSTQVRTIDLRSSTVGNDDVSAIVISVNGTHFAFVSTADNLRSSTDPSPNHADVFVRGDRKSVV